MEGSRPPGLRARGGQGGSTKVLKPKRRRSRVGRADHLLPPWLAWGVRAFACAFIAVPVLYMIVLSLSPEIDVDGGEVLPSKLVFTNYTTAWSEVDLLRGFGNSLLICGVAALAATIVATAAAYPLARLRFRGDKVLLYGALALQLVPGPMVLLPFFVAFSILQVALGLTIIGTYWGIMLTYLTFSLPLAMWIMLGYLRTVPRELEEAAWVDGASPVTALRKVVVPLAVPGMVVAFLFSMLLGWNDVLFASVLTSNSTRTLAIDIDLFTATLGGQTLPQYGALMAAGVMAGIPIVGIYLLLQRYLVGGLTAGAVR